MPSILRVFSQELEFENYLEESFEFLLGKDPNQFGWYTVGTKGKVEKVCSGLRGYELLQHKQNWDSTSEEAHGLTVHL